MSIYTTEKGYEMAGAIYKAHNGLGNTYFVSTYPFNKNSQRRKYDNLAGLTRQESILAPVMYDQNSCVYITEITLDMWNDFNLGHIPINKITNGYFKEVRLPYDIKNLK